MSKIVILCGSVRRDGNTETLARAFAEGAAEHSEVKLLSAADLAVKPCTGCNFCYTSEGNRCAQTDGMAEVYDALRQADVLVIASPVYFYGLSAQLKAVIDRLHTPMRNTFPIRKLALLLVGGAELPELFDSILVQYRLALNFFHLEDAGQVLVRGVRDRNDIQGNPALDEARALGRSMR